MTFAYLPVNVGLALGPAIGSLVSQVNIFAVFPAAAAITAAGVAAMILANRRAVGTTAQPI